VSQSRLHVCTLFDKTNRPLLSLLRWSDGTVRLYKLYHPGTGKSIYGVEQDIKRLVDEVRSAKLVVMNDVIGHYLAFDLPSDLPVVEVDVELKPAATVTGSAEVLVAAMKRMLGEPLARWRALMGGASKVFAALQKRGFICGCEHIYPQWGYSWSGRSKLMGVDTKTLVDGDVSNPNGDSIFINLDWVSADVRVLAIMSGDKRLEEAFAGDSDPYEVILKEINDGVSADEALSRSEAKVAMLSAVYSFDVSSPVFKVYSRLGEWLAQMRERLAEHGCLKTILGREFVVGGERTERSVVNAVVQGSVAHAMHAVLCRAWAKLRDSILLDNHDSLVLTASTPADVGRKLDAAIPIMTRPFAGILDANPNFPVRISVGKAYRRWKFLKRVNGI